MATWGEAIFVYFVPAIIYIKFYNSAPKDFVFIKALHVRISNLA